MVQSNSLSQNEDFAVSVVTPWVKGNMSVDEGFLKVKIQNTILFGLIPAGMHKDTSPLQSVSNVYTSKEYKLSRLILGVIIILLGFSMFSSSFLGAIIALVIGAAVLFSGILTVFAYERSGIEKKIYLPFFEANHASEFEEQVISAMRIYQEDRNVRMHSQNSSDQIVNAINNQN
ncbi:DUF2892 domain-containing protein [Leuconostoc carnosum]|uniref:DUF2892 domain-containing protein n=2 Tax=Leuconostoc carnosum TaxID=1252 RepID=UPI00123847A2|nr:DUF2892 domain-containing protein [Leuconostoc carnosum]KAA8380742.1 DUF2892 domain-containing protein [Leuconostoc carnosum]